MSKLPKKYYSLEETAKRCHCTIDDFLYYGEAGKLQLCVVLESTLVEERKSRPVNKEDPLFEIIQGNSAKPVYLMESTGTKNIRGIYPLCEENVLRIGRGKSIDSVEDFSDNSISYHFGLIDDDLKFQPIERKFEITDLVITHNEKVRFEAVCAPVRGEIGIRERENLLRLIGALIEINYGKKDFKRTDGTPNANKIAEKFKQWLTLHDFSDKGISAKSLRTLIPKAYNLIMENREETASNVKLKIIKPS